MNKEDKIRIKKLKKEKKYNEIYIEYGQKEYLKNIPSKVKRKELKFLKKEGRYQDIYNKYGNEEYCKILNRAMFKEIRETRGISKALLWELKIFFKIIVETPLVTASAFAVVYSIKGNIELQYNEIKYKNEIELYNNKINDYADEVNSMDLSDTQIFMKVMDDMWGNIKGYKNPEKDIYGFLELDLASEDGYGVCRNMASDVAKKLNAIDSRYHARTMAVYVGENERYKVANIYRNIIENNESNSDIEKVMNENMEKIFGNHMVTIVDVPEDNLIIVLDPTNPGIGIYKDGEIYMLNSRLEEGTEFESKEVTNCFFSGKKNGELETVMSFYESFKNSELTKEEIEEKYGIEAQNRALEEVRQMSLSQQDKFRDEYKVDVNQIDNELDKIEQEREMQKIITNVQQERE